MPISDITINWGTKVITVPKTATDLVQSSPSEIRQMDLNAFRGQLNDLQDDPEGIVFDTTHTHNKAVAIGGVELARVIEMINNYTVTFEDGQYAINLIGANSNVADRVNVNQVSVRAANSAGLVTSQAIEFGEYGGEVTLDTVNGVSGSLYPIGTLRQPCGNLIDAKIIAEARGFSRIKIVGDFSFLGTNPIAQVNTVTPIAVSLGVYNTNVAGVLYTFTADATATLEEVTLGITNAINAGVGAQTAVDTGTTVTITADVPGIAFTTSVSGTGTSSVVTTTANVPLTSLDGFTVVGESPSKTSITLTPLAAITNCIFKEATISGELDGGNSLTDCHIGTVNYIDGNVHDCQLDLGTITLSGEKAGFIRCWSGVPGLDTPIIDMGGTGTDLLVRDYQGGLCLLNYTSGSDNISIDMTSGHVKLGTSILDGYFLIRGLGKLTDESNGAVVNSDDLINKALLTGITNLVSDFRQESPSAVEITNKVWTADLLDFDEEESAGYQLTNTSEIVEQNLVTPEQLVNKIWDEDTSTHNVSGSFGEKISKKLLTLSKWIGIR